jgi:hypothetical protein
VHEQFAGNGVHVRAKINGTLDLPDTYCVRDQPLEKILKDHEARKGAPFDESPL